MSCIEFIYFDLGNVLVSFDHTRAFRAVSHLTGLTPGHVEDVLFNRGLQVRYEKGEISTAEFHQYFCEQTGTEITLEQLCFAASDIFEPLDDTIGLLRALKHSGRRLGLLSNTCDCHWRFLLDDGSYQFLQTDFEHTVLSFVAGMAKPEKEIYRFAADIAGCKPETILFIDDKQENVEGAHAYGFDGIHFQCFTGLRNELTKRGLMQ